MGKHIRTFESFSQSEYNDQYESLTEELDNLFGDAENLFEASEEEWETKLERTLRPGEKRALARDYEIITDGQLAGMYLRALGVNEEDPNKFIHHITSETGVNILDFAETKRGERIWTNAALADALGLQSFTTYYRTVNKFKNLLSGVGATEGEDLYEKVIEAYDKFKNMNVYDVGSLAGTALSTSTKLRDALAVYATGKDSREKEKHRELLNSVLGVANYEAQLAKTFPTRPREQVRQQALNVIAQKYELDITKLKEEYIKYLGKNV